MSGTNKKILIVLAVVAVLLIVLAIAGKKKGWIGRGEEVEVTTAKVEKHTIIETVSASGKIFPETEVTISPDVSGEIIEIYYEEGDTVQKDDLIIEIKPDIYQSIVERTEAALNQSKANLANARARLTQIEAQLKNTKQIYERNKKLFDQKVISDQEFENIQANYEVAQSEYSAARESVRGAEFNVKSAQAALKEARDNLVKTKIHAPMNGIISQLNVEKGERVVGTSQMPGTEMLAIADFSKMEIQVDVSENDILRVSEGDTAEIDIDAYLDRTFKGVVRHIANSANVLSQLTSEQVTNFTVNIRILPNSYEDLLTEKNRIPFKPGMSASVEIHTDTRKDVIAVPIQCVTIQEGGEEADSENEKQEIVFVYDAGKVAATPVESGIQDDRFIEIKSGLSAEDEVVTGPYRAISKLLQDGDYVNKVTEKELRD